MEPAAPRCERVTVNVATDTDRVGRLRTMDKAEETGEKTAPGRDGVVDKLAEKRTHKKARLFPRWSATVERRLKALKKLEYEAIKRTVDYYVELHALETKYQELLAPLDQRRCDIINGDVQPSDSDCEWSTDESDTESNKSPVKQTSENEATINDEHEQKGIPDFWLNLLESRTFLPEQIQEHDRMALKSLKNIKIIYLPNSYRLEFEFGENDYFNNAVLSKQYDIDFAPSTTRGRRLQYYGPTSRACTGCVIDWKPGKDLTKLLENDDSAEYKDSFFNFFTRTSTLDPAAVDDEVTSLLEAEFQFVRIMRQYVLPRAASVYANHYFMDNADEMDSYVDEDDEEYEPHECCPCNVELSSYLDDDDDDDD